jgi:gp16 family phage-associated protein
MDVRRVKEHLRWNGVTVRQFLASKGLSESDYQTAINLLNGFSKGVRGKSYRIAVALGLKEGGCHD